MGSSQPGGVSFSSEHGLIVRRSPQDAVPYAVFEGAGPTPRQIDEVVSKGYGIHFIGSRSDLRFLAGLPGLTHLGVTGHDLDTRSISELRALISLELMIADAPETDLAGLQALSSYSGVLRGFESVLHAPNLEVAELHDVYEGSLPAVPRQLRGLTLHGARQVRELAVGVGVDDSELRELYLHGCRRFDVRSLVALPHLEALTLESIANVIEIGSLAELPALRLLSVLRCRSAEGILSLADVRGLKVLVVGKLAEEARNIADQTDPPWTLLTRL